MAFLTFLLNFSGIYLEEAFLPDGAVRLDFSDLEGAECYCSDASGKEICRRISPFPFRALHWIDGGDYHYVSKFWLEKIDRPFDLVLFDHHSDDQPPAWGEGLLSCGAWVAQARRDLPLLRETFWVPGVPEFPSRTPVPGEPLRADPSSLRPEASGRPAFLCPGRPVYLSIDKDVLSPEFARTNWDQGEMTLLQLEDLVRSIASVREILGVDICGGLSVSKGACGKDVEINRRCDEELQAFFVSLQTI